MRQSGPGEQERSAYVDVVHQVVAFHIDLFCLFQVDSRGIVDDDVNAAELFYCRVHGSLDICFLPNISDDRQSVPAGFTNFFGSSMDGSWQFWMWFCGLG